MTHKLEYERHEAGNWVLLIIDGEVMHEGHEIDDYTWIELMKRYIGLDVSIKVDVPSLEWR